MVSHFNVIMLVSIVVIGITIAIACHKEHDCKEFLATVGVMVLVMVTIAWLMKHLGKPY